MIGTSTRPVPKPIKMDATNNKGEEGRKKNPTPTPIIRVPPTAHELLSSFLVVIVFDLRKLAFQFKLYCKDMP